MASDTKTGDRAKRAQDELARREHNKKVKRTGEGKRQDTTDTEMLNLGNDELKAEAGIDVEKGKSGDTNGGKAKSKS